MSTGVIRKGTSGRGVTPNLVDYDGVRASFSWETARREITGLPEAAGLNIAHETIDRHASGSLGNRVALKWLGKSGVVRNYTYAQMRELTSRFANALQSLGIGEGDRVFTLAGRIPELYVTAIGTLKNRSILSPLFSAFGPELIRARLCLGKAKALITTESLYRRKVAQLRDSLPNLQHVVVAGEEGHPTDIPGTHDFHNLLGRAGSGFSIAPTSPEHIALLHFTSGTTGRPKGAMHVHGAVIAHLVTAELALDLHPEDVFWCTADPGWVTGISYGIIAPLAVGATVLVDEGEFDAERWCRVLQDQRVAVWYTSPTAVRMMMLLGVERVRQYDLTRLRFAASVGEPLNPEAVFWSREALGTPLHDNWWQTETGAIMIANYASMDVKPGSMGRPLPGIDAAIVRRAKGGDIELLEQPETKGELALRAGWPSMFRGYLDEEEEYHKRFAGGWYLTGDLATRDEDGYFWFAGRADDVIKSAGHLIGPFEVESELMAHPAVAEAGVIGKPDRIAMEVVKAFVALKPGYRPDETLRRQLIAHARSHLGTAVAPKEIEFRANLPKTHSGKIMRRSLKAQELGLPTGDISTPEEEA